MNTAVVQIYDILNESKLMEKVDIYTNSVPESAQSIPSLPVARIVEIESKYGNFNSNNPFSIDMYAQIDIWVNTMDEVEHYYFAIDALMREQGWECTYTEQAEDEDLPNCKRIIKRYAGTIELKF